MIKNNRIKSLPPYLFVEIDKAKRKARAGGKDLIDLGIGDPDQPTPSFIINRLAEAAKDSANHRYALDFGMISLREAIACWYKRKFNVRLNPKDEILPLIGSKEGIAHLPLAILNKGDYSLIPDPCYPPYISGTIFADGRVYSMPLVDKNDFLPDLKKIPKTILKRAKIIFVNYPNNPTSAIATDQFYKELIKFAIKNNLIIVSDMAYSEISFDNYKPKSILQFKGARTRAIEFHSLSKTYNMTGWRIGWALGNKELIALLGEVKSNIDSGIFQAIQIAAIDALNKGEKHIEKMRQLYQGRRDTIIVGLRSLGWEFKVPLATFYLWVKVPRGYNSSTFTKLLLDKCGIVVAPGVGFGKRGEGYIRLALTVSKERINKAIIRLKKLQV